MCFLACKWTEANEKFLLCSELGTHSTSKLLLSSRSLIGCFSRILKDSWSKEINTQNVLKRLGAYIGQDMISEDSLQIEP